MPPLQGGKCPNFVRNFTCITGFGSGGLWIGRFVVPGQFRKLISFPYFRMKFEKPESYG